MFPAALQGTSFVAYPVNCCLMVLYRQEMRFDAANMRMLHSDTTIKRRCYNLQCSDGSLAEKKTAEGKEIWF
jgi:hypothetical protein